MNASATFTCFPRRFSLAALSFALAVAAGAQSPSAPGPDNKMTGNGAGPDLAAARAAVDGAKMKVKAGDLDAAEQAISSLNLAAANSAEWHLETAQRLVQLAEQVGRDGAPANVAAMARKALDHLARGERLASAPAIKANAKMLAGFIHERFLANSSQAAAHYRAAAQLVPESARAKEAAERAERTDQTFRDKLKNAGK